MQLSWHSTAPTRAPTLQTRLQFYVRHTLFPREKVGEDVMSHSTTPTRWMHDVSGESEFCLCRCRRRGMPALGRDRLSRCMLCLRLSVARGSRERVNENAVRNYSTSTADGDLTRWPMSDVTSAAPQRACARVGHARWLSPTPLILIQWRHGSWDSITLL